MINFIKKSAGSTLIKIMTLISAGMIYGSAYAETQGVVGNANLKNDYAVAFPDSHLQLGNLKYSNVEVKEIVKDGVKVYTFRPTNLNDWHFTIHLREGRPQGNYCSVSIGKQKGDAADKKLHWVRQGLPSPKVACKEVHLYSAGAMDTKVEKVDTKKN